LVLRFFFFFLALSRGDDGREAHLARHSFFFVSFPLNYSTFRSLRTAAFFSGWASSSGAVVSRINLVPSPPSQPSLAMTRRFYGPCPLLPLSPEFLQPVPRKDAPLTDPPYPLSGFLFFHSTIPSAGFAGRFIPLLSSILTLSSRTLFIPHPFQKPSEMPRRCLRPAFIIWS